MSRPATSALGRSLSLKSLRLAFFSFGVVLLCTLGVVATIANQRLEEARLEREEMVASRVFDEMEREVSAFLELENERPRYARLAQTNPETWAPFVVGYFSAANGRNPKTALVVVAEGQTGEHRRRMNWALRKAGHEWAASVAKSEREAAAAYRRQAIAPGAVPLPLYNNTPTLPRNLPEQDVAKTSPQTAPTAKDNDAAPRPSPAPSKPSSDREIIESLNRAPERRKTKTKASSPSESQSDPFNDYSLSY